MALTGGYNRIKTRGEKLVSSSAFKTKRTYKKIKGGKKTLKRRKQRKSKRRY